MDAADGRVVSNFVVQALAGRPLTVYGDGSQTRSFCYVDDLVEGLIRLIETPDDVTGPVNLGNPVEFTIRQLAELVIELTGSSSKVVFNPLPQDDPKQRCPDISLAKSVLGWQPQIQLREGLKRTIDYFDLLLREKKA
jgi:UDP-glucuronate decarboxylase